MAEAQTPSQPDMSAASACPTGPAALVGFGPVPSVARATRDRTERARRARPAKGRQPPCVVSPFLDSSARRREEMSCRDRTAFSARAFRAAMAGDTSLLQLATALERRRSVGGVGGRSIFRRAL